MFEKATKEKTKLRLAITGPTGCGKTYSALRIASGIGGKIAVICTENKSARKYADDFNFDVCDLTDYSIQSYTNAINQAKNHDVLIIDSLTHAWQSVLEYVDKLAKTKYKDNSYRAWGEGNPLHHNFVKLIFSFPGHIICTMRSKMEYVLEQNEKGRMTPRKVGLTPNQGKDIEYEFDLLMMGNEDHIFHISKDRTGKFQDEYIEKPGEDFGKELAAWLGVGKEPLTEDEKNFIKVLEMAGTKQQLENLSARVDQKDLPDKIKDSMQKQIEDKAATIVD